MYRKTITGGWTNQPIWKIILVKMGSYSHPQIGVEDSKIFESTT